MSEIVIRRAKTQDTGALFEMNETFNGKGVTSLDRLKTSILSLEQELTLIAEVDGKAAGFCCGQIVWSMSYSDASGEITELYVDESYRRMGIASKMVASMEDVLTNRGVKSFRVCTNINNANARALYSRLGYTLSNEVVYTKNNG